MLITLAATGKFHFVDLAKQMYRLGVLANYFTGYPKWKLRSASFPPGVVRYVPFLHSAYMLSQRWNWLPPVVSRELDYLDRRHFDQTVTRALTPCDVYTAISSCGLASGQAAQRLGAKYVCDRGSTHIQTQNELLRAEYARWKAPYLEVDPRVMEREMAEYDLADLITVPSGFAKTSFIRNGIDGKKVAVVPYGVDLSQFQSVAEPDPDKFVVVFVGGLNLRKGIQYLLQAFAELRVPRKVLNLIGQADPLFIKQLGSRPWWTPEVLLHGHVPQEELRQHLSRAHVLVLPSVEDGFGLVVSQALACGCPVITTRNTGAHELIEDGQNGYVIDAGDTVQLKRALERLAEERGNADMRHNAIESVRAPGGWDTYGDRVLAVYKNLCGKPVAQ